MDLTEQIPTAIQQRELTSVNSYVEFCDSMVFLADEATYEPEWDNTYSNKLHF